MNSGEWNKPPTLTAARKLFALKLSDIHGDSALGEMAEFINGTSYDRRQVALDGTPIIRISNISDPSSDYIRTVEDFKDKYRVKVGDLLASWSASFKTIIWPGPEGILNQHIFSVKERSGHSRRYLRHAIEAAFDEMQESVVGIGMMHLRRQDFLGHRVPSPPSEVQEAVSDYLDWLERDCVGLEPSLPKSLAEQRRIVAKIERLAAKVEEARSLRASSDTLAGHLRDAVTSGLFPESHGDTVGDHFQIQSGYAFRSAWFTPSGIRLLRNVNVSHGVLDWTQSARIPESMRGEFERFELHEGDVVLSLDRPLISTGLKIARVSEQDLPCLLLQRVGRFKATTDAVDRGYLFGWLQSAQFTGAIDPGRSLGVPHISQKEVASIPLPVPPIEVQREIVVRISKASSAMKAVKEVGSHTSRNLDALLPSILDKAFKGEL